MSRFLKYLSYFIQSWKGCVLANEVIDFQAHYLNHLGDQAIIIYNFTVYHHMNMIGNNNIGLWPIIFSNFCSIHLNNENDKGNFAAAHVSAVAPFTDMD